MFRLIAIGIVAMSILDLPAYAQDTLSPEILLAAPAEVPKLIPSEYSYVRLEAVNGSPYAKHNAFVYVYENPEVLHEFVPEAVEFLAAAAEAGIPDAQFNLGFLYRKGEWVPKDREKAQEWLTKSANTGHVRAQFWSAQMCLDLYYDAGEGKEADEYFACGEKWLRGVVDADQNCLECLWGKASLGRALLSRSLQDTEGWDLLREATTAGHAGAKRTLFALEEMLLDFEARGYEHARELLDDLQPFLRSIEAQTAGSSEG